MTALVQAALRFRRTARSGWGLGAALILAAFLLAGFFVPGHRELGWGHAAWLAAWLGLFGYRLRHAQRYGTDPRSAFELGVWLLVGVFALVQFRGGVESHLYPFTYVAVALVAAFASGWAGIGVIAIGVALGFAIAFLAEGVVDPLLLGVHALFTIGFGSLSYLFTRAEIVRVRRKSELELAAQREKARDDIRLFRLVAPTSDGVRDEERLYQTSVQEVRQALYHALQLLHQTLELHTCVLLMPADEDEELRIAELVTKSDDIADGHLHHSVGVQFRHDDIDPVGEDVDEFELTGLTPVASRMVAPARVAAPTATTLPSAGFSLAESGIMIPPAVFSSSSNLLTRIRSFNGRIFMVSPPVYKMFSYVNGLSR